METTFEEHPHIRIGHLCNRKVAFFLLQIFGWQIDALSVGHFTEKWRSQKAWEASDNLGELASLRTAPQLGKLPSIRTAVLAN